MGTLTQAQSAEARRAVTEFIKTWGSHSLNELLTDLCDQVPAAVIGSVNRTDEKLLAEL